MKNKEITIYELMGLIKDGKAPYEIVYKNSKYFIDELEGYYKREDETALFELIFDYYNDYDALQVKVKILAEENNEWEDIEEMTLSPKNISLTSVVLENRDVINQLIKNQKYLKGKLDKDENNI